MARKRFDKRNGWYIGIFPEDHEVGFVSGRKGLRRNLIPIADIDNLPTEQAYKMLDASYHAKQYEILNQKAKDKEEKTKRQRLKKKQTLKSASKLWIKEVSATQSATTANRYQQSLDVFFASIPDMPVNEFGREENIKFFKALEQLPNQRMPDQPISPATQNKHMRHLQVFIQWCYDLEYTDRLIKLKKPQAPQKEMETFTEDQLERLERHLKKLNDYTIDADGKKVHPRITRRNQNLYRAFMLARHTLLRSGAVWSLKLSNIDLENRIIRITEANVETKNAKGEIKSTLYQPKKMKWPNKPINDSLFNLLKDDLAQRKPYERYYLDDGRGFAWHEQNGKMAVELKKEIKKLGLNENLKPFHHGIRASGITWLLNKGVAPQVVQQLADHSNLTTTMGYYDTRKASQMQATNLLG